jgi:hypothetical protein
MSDFSTGEYKPKQLFFRNGSVSNTPTERKFLSYKIPGTNAFSNVPNPASFRGQVTGTGRTQTSAGVPAPTDLRGLVSGAQSADAAARRAGEVMPPAPTQESNPMLDLLRQMFNQAGQGSGGRTVDLSGYDATLGMLDQETERVSDRYKKYTGQISDIYGTLSGINQSMIEKIAPRGEAIRAGLSAQEAERAAAARSAEQARLSTATEARAALGLEDLAGQYAGGDVVTEQSEGMVADSEAQRSAAENTLLANEAIAQQQGANQQIGYGLQQEQSARQLQTSLEDALAAIRAERANVQTQRSQAASQAGGGSGPNLGAQLEILQQIQAIEAGQPATDPVGMFLQQNPSLAPAAGPLVNTFADWVTDNYTDLFNRSGSKKADPLIAIERFKASSPEARRALNQSPLLAPLLSQYYNSIANPARSE